MRYYPHTLVRFLSILLVCGMFTSYIFSVPHVESAPNYQINYQGKLTNASNVAVADGTYNMRFWLLTSAVTATTSAVWTEELTGTNRVQVTNGLFSVMLGSTTPLSGVDFNQVLYLGVEIGGTSTPVWDGEMSPRKTLGAVPAAFEADRLDGLTSSQFARTDATTSIATSSVDTLLSITQSGTGNIFDVFDGAQNVFTIRDGGFVGLGTTTPSRLLTIQGGDAWIGGNLTATGTLTISGLTTLGYASTTGISGTNLTFTNGIISFASTTGLTATNANLTNLTIGGDTITDFVGSGLALSGSTLTATGDGVSNWSLLNGALTPSSTLGLRINASSTIGDGTGAGGLTIYGNSTTTGSAYFNSSIGIGTTTPSATLSIAGTGLTNPLLIASSTGSALLTLNTRGTLVFGTTTNANIFLNGGPTSTAVNSLFRRNIALGHDTLAYIDTTVSVIDNIAIGFEALRGSPSVPMTGGSNLAFGYQALKLNTAGSYNNALGIDALSSNTTGSNNNALSTEALVLNTTGSNNNALGQFALYSNTIGSKNNAFGDLAGFTNTIGNANTFLGALTDALSNNLSTSTAIGAGAVVGCSNCMVLGGTGVNYVNVGLGTTTPSRLLTIQGGDAWIGGNLTATGTLTISGLTTLGYASTTGISGTNLTFTNGNISYASTTALTLLGSLYDGSQSVGTNGMVLQTTGSGVQWVATSSLGFNSTGDGVSNWLTTNGALTPSSTLGLRINASSTIGDGTGAGGLTIYGNSTTTGDAYVGGRLSLGSTSPSAILSIDAAPDNTTDYISVGSSTAGVATSSTYFRIASTGRSYLTGAAVDPVFIAEERGGDPDFTLAGANDIAVVGDYAYVVTNNLQYSLVILDISNPTDPIVISELQETQIFNDVIAIEVVGSYAYLLNYSRASLAVVDVSDPKNPRIVAEERGPVPGTTLAGVYDFKISGSFAYMVNEGSNSLAIIDVSNPLDPVFVSEKVDGRFNLPQSIAIQGKYAYVTNVGGDSLVIVDISNPYESAIVGSVTNALLDGAYGISVSGRYAYIGATDADRFVVVDVSNPTSPTIVGSVTNPTLLNGAKHIALAGNLAYVAAGVNDSVTVVDISSSTNPRVVAVEYGPTPGTSLDGILGLAIQGNYLYTTNYVRNSIAVLDIGGADISTFAAGVGQIESLSVLHDARFNQNLFVGGGLNVGSRGFSSGGVSSVTAIATTSLAQVPAFSVYTGDNNAASVVDVLSLTHMVTSTATPAQNGLGAGLLFNNETDFGLATSTSRIASIFTNVSSTSPQSALTFSNKNTAGALTEFMRLNHSGNLGLGTTSPSAKLTISQGIGGSGNLFHIASSSNGTATSTYMMVTQAGRVGIGTTTPSQLLDIASGSTHAGIALTAATTSNPFIHFKEGTSVRGDVYYDSGANTFQVRALESGSDLILKAGGDVERMRITATGLLGLGTTTPSRLLTIQGGDAWIGGNLTATGTLTLTNTTNGLLVADNTGLVSASGTLSASFLDSLVLLDTEIDTSSELSALLTDETGSGAAVFANAPTLSGILTGDEFVFNTATTTYLYSPTVSSTQMYSGTFRAGVSGSTSSPAFTFAGNTTSGLAWDAGVAGPALVRSGVTALMVRGSAITHVMGGSYTVGQMYVGSTTSGGKALFTRGSDGNTSAWIGRDSSTGNAFGLMNESANVGANIFFGTNLRERMTIDVAGNVGIGSTSPAAKLTVTQGIGGSGNLFQVASSSDGLATSTIFAILSNGNVGIGTTSASMLEPLSRILAVSADNSDTVRIKLNNTMGQWELRQNSGSHQFTIDDNTNNRIGFNITSTGDIHLAPEAGNVGIGTTTPGSRLTVTGGDAWIGGNLTATGTATFADVVTTNATTSGVAYFGSRVGIGVNNPTTTLAVQGDGSINPFFVSAFAGDASFLVDTLGRVSIGTTTSQGSLFTVYSSSTDAVITLRSDDDNNDPNQNPFIEFIEGAVEKGHIGTTGSTGFAFDSTLIGSTHDMFAVHGVDGLYLATAGRVWSAISADGNFGIGDTAPTTAKLSIIQNMNNGTDDLFRIASSSNGTATSTRFVIDAYGRVGMGGTSTLTSLLALDNRSLTGSVVGGMKEYLSFVNSTENATYYGNEMYITNSPTATSTLVGSIIRVEDTSSLGNTVNGLEVQTDRGTNALGINTAVSGFGRTFGVRGTTVGNAGQLALPAGVFAETEGTTQGNALRAYSGSITTETLVSFFQDASVFSGTGLEMNFGNAGGSFAATSSAKFIDFQVAGTSKFTVTAGGTTTIGDGTTGTMAGLQIGFGGLCVDNDGSCTASTSGRITSVSSALGNSDLAEVYFSDDELRTGEIVSLAGGLSIERADETNARDVVGVVSTKPGLLLGHDDTSLKSGETGYPIGLSGRVPVILSTENGPIAKGDRITLSSIPGVGMKATESSRVVGIAMEDFDGDHAYSEGFLNQFGDDLVRERTTARRENYDERTQDGCYYGSGVTRGEVCESSEIIFEEVGDEDVDPEREREEILAEYRNQDAHDEVLSSGDTVAVGQVLMFIELTNYASDRERMVLSALAATSTLDGSDETLWDRITSLAQNFVAGVLSVLELKADKVQVQEQLCVEDVCVTADDLRMLLQNAQNQGGGGLPTPDLSTPSVPSGTSEEGDAASGDATENDASENLESLENTSDSGDNQLPTEGENEVFTEVGADVDGVVDNIDSGLDGGDDVGETVQDVVSVGEDAFAGEDGNIPQVVTETEALPSILEDNAPQI